MADLIYLPIAVVYLSVVGSLFIYGINFFYLTIMSWRKRHCSFPPLRMTVWPAVTVQLPIYNELYVAKRLLKAASAMDYPKSLLEIQVLDDSTDKTFAIVSQIVHELKSKGINITHLHRENRTGFKSGALAEGLERASAEFIAIFDADFIPPPSFLQQTIPFFQDKQVGFIQTRWGHANRDYSFLTYLQSLAIDAHFMVEQFARSQAGFWFNFNGTAGVWRKKAIQDAGGWTADTLTEDLDLSYRAFLRGWNGMYLKDIEVPSELPVSFSGYRRQQQRWARGSLECARKFLPLVWRATIPISQKIQATLHLLGYGVHLLLGALVVIYPVVLLLSERYVNLVSLFGLAFMFNATALAPTVFFIAAQVHLGRTWWKLLPAILFISFLGAGMMMNTLRAAYQAFGKTKGIFERTPKYGITQRKQHWINQQYQLDLDPIVWLEITLVLLNIATVILAIKAQNWFIGIYALIFCIGLLFTSSMTIYQAVIVSLGRSNKASHFQTRNTI